VAAELSLPLSRNSIEYMKKTLELAMHLIRDFAQQSELTITVLIDTARPILDNFADELFKQLPGFITSKNRIRDEYRDTFRERLDGTLRDIKVGFVGGRSVAAQQGVGTTTAKMSDTLILKLTFMGMGIDLQNAWRWVCNKWRGGARGR
jgi:hypothetical protein